MLPELLLYLRSLLPVGDRTALFNSIENLCRKLNDIGTIYVSGPLVEHLIDTGCPTEYILNGMIEQEPGFITQFLCPLCFGSCR